MDRRGIVSIAALVVIAGPTFAADDIDGGKLSYRGFTVDVSAFQTDPNFAATESSLKHQIDIAADCGAEAKIIDFFRGRRIALKLISGDEPGQWVPTRGIEIDATPQPPDKPILLHELLHAGGIRRNAKIVRGLERRPAAGALRIVASGPSVDLGRYWERHIKVV